MAQGVISTVIYEIFDPDYKLFKTIKMYCPKCFYTRHWLATLKGNFCPICGTMMEESNWSYAYKKTKRKPFKLQEHTSKPLFDDDSTTFKEDASVIEKIKSTSEKYKNKKLF
jgi:uncharacterized Zn finger protein (UPF0148 family)